MSTLTCIRCRRTVPALERPPIRGELGQELQKKICEACWAEWLQAEVMVINELRLDFMDPKSQEILLSQMREFLGLDGPTRPSE